MTGTRAWHLKSRPTGMPDMGNFELKELELPALEEGMVRVENRWLSVDPYMRGRMNDVKSYVPPFEVGAPLQGGAGRQGGREPRTGPGGGRYRVPHARLARAGGWPRRGVNKVPAMGVGDEQWLGNLGLTGATAYFGLLRTAEAKAGDTVFVSAAAGAGRLGGGADRQGKGMTVIGSAGGADKAAWVRELGADAAIDYKAGPLVKALQQAAPKGIDVYFDNVGGDHLDAALATARNNARFAICGMIENYNGGEPPSFRYMMRIISARIMLKASSTPTTWPRCRTSTARWAAGSPAGR
jgi:NADPH-dependent curcumin reductase CurA